MFTERRKKLAIAAAILVVGFGAALLFRREEAEPEVAHSAPSVAPRPKIRSAVAEVEPSAKLAGRIEPYSSPSTAQGEETKTSDAVDATPLKPSNAERIAPPVESTAQVVSSSAAAKSGGGELTTTDSSLKWQNVRRPQLTDSSARLPQDQRGLPETSAEREAQLHSAVATTARHTIVDGDTLAAIAHRHLGDPARHLEIYEHNRDVLASPELLPIGKELRIPLSQGVTFTETASLRHGESSIGETRLRGDAESSRLVAVAPAPVRQIPLDSAPVASAAPAAGAKTYVVQPHDTLALIARKLFGDISRQGELIGANRQQLRTPKDLRPGMKLVVPATTGRSR